MKAWLNRIQCAAMDTNNPFKSFLASNTQCGVNRMTLLLWYTVEKRTAQYATVQDSRISHISKRQAESDPQNKASSVSNRENNLSNELPWHAENIELSMGNDPPTVTGPGSQTAEEVRLKSTRVCTHAHVTTADKWISCRLLYTSRGTSS